MRESQLIRSKALLGSGKGFCLILGAIVALALTLAPAAFGATASVDAGGTLTYQADPDETNSVTITLSGADYIVTETGAGTMINAGTGCSSPATGQVNCPESTVTSGIAVDAGDLNDVVVLDASVTAGAVLNGGIGDDSLTGSGGNDTLDGGDGIDTASYSTAAAGVSVDLAAGTASGEGTDTLTGIENAAGSQLNDTLTGSADVNILTGNNGDDLINSRDSVADQIFCGDGADQVTADPSDIPATDCEQVDLPPVETPPPPDPPTANGTQLVVASGKPRLVASFVLIAGRALKSRKRVVWIKLNCSGNKDCAGVVGLTTANRVRVTRKRRQRVKLGSAKFFIPAPRTMKVKIRLSKRKFRLVKRLKRVKVMVTVIDRDRAGRARIGTRAIALRVR